MRAFVTGARGFVGRHLVPRLEAGGWEVVAVDLEVDVADPGAVDAAIRAAKPGLIVHLAAITSVSESRDAPALTYAVNFLGTRSVLEAARHHAPAARVLLVGSGDTYGSAVPGSRAFRETDPLCPRSPYARAKAAAELLAVAYAERGVDVVCTRSFNHSGPGQRDAFVLSSFARQAAEIANGTREPRMRVGNLDSVRDFLDVEDVIDAYIALSDRSTPGGIYNVASGRGVRIGHALDRILAIAGVRAAIETDPARMRPADFASGDPTRLKEATGWSPRIGLDETLRRLVEGWRAELSAGA